MHPGSLLILVLSHSGYWIAGTDGMLSLRWAVPDQSLPAIVLWDLSFHSIRLGHGSVEINSGDGETRVRIKCPTVRTRIRLDLHYRVLSIDRKTELDAGITGVEAFPIDLTNGWERRMAGLNLTVIDDVEGLPVLLTRARVRFTRAEHVSAIQLGCPDMVLVGANRLDDSPFSQSFIQHQARAGAGIMIFQQAGITRLMGHAVVHRTAPERLDWDTLHPLLAHLNTDDLASWVRELPNDVAAVRLPGDDSSLSIAGWARDISDTVGQQSNDSLLTIQRIGHGRIVLCQLPLGSWKTDPRAVLLLGNALDYLATRSEAPPVASRPIAWRPVLHRNFATVRTPAGDDR